MCNKRRQTGLTIIELVIFIVIVGIAAAGILRVINQSTGASTDPVRRKQAILIAEAYMEEIQQAQFTVCDPADANAAIATDANAAAPVGCAASSTTEKLGPEAGNTRPYDNVNDYVPVGYTLGTPVRAFAVADASGKLVDRDVSGAALGVNAVGSALGKVAMDGITTTLTLNLVNGLGGTITSTAQNMIALQITITVNYGPGESVTLDGYRTRYQPGAL